RVQIPEFDVPRFAKPDRVTMRESKMPGNKVETLQGIEMLVMPGLVGLGAAGGRPVVVAGSIVPSQHPGQAGKRQPQPPPAQRVRKHSLRKSSDSAWSRCSR